MTQVSSDKAKPSAEPRPRTRARRRAQTRERLIESAILCMRDVGYFDTTTTMIAERANVSRGALQYHFPTRSDLLLAVIEFVGEELKSAFSPDLRSNMSVEGRVERICETYWNVYRSDAYIAQIQIWIGARNDPGLNEKIEALTGRMLKEQQSLWRDVFSDLAVPPDQLGALRSLTLSAVRGLALRPAVRPKTGHWPNEIAVLCGMLTHALKSGGRQLGVSRTQPPRGKSSNGARQTRTNR